MARLAGPDWPCPADGVQVKVIMVMGHTGCGAVKAALSGRAFPGFIDTLVDSLDVAVAMADHDLGRRLEGGGGGPEVVDEVVKDNVKYQVRLLGGEGGSRFLPNAGKKCHACRSKLATDWRGGAAGSRLHCTARVAYVALKSCVRIKTCMHAPTSPPSPPTHPPTQVQRCMRSALIATAVHQSKLLLVGAVYHIDTGKVEVLGDTLHAGLVLTKAS